MAAEGLQYCIRTCNGFRTKLFKTIDRRVLNLIYAHQKYRVIILFYPECIFPIQFET